MSLESGRWQLFSASVTGSAHIIRRRCCEDSSAHIQLPNGSWFAVIADGAGSARFAQEASDIAVRKGMSFLNASLETPGPLSEELLTVLLRNSVIEAHEALVGRAAELGVKPSEFATTFISLCATTEWVGAAQIGDGGIVARGGGKPLSLLFAPAHGEYVNETFFVTFPDFIEHTHTAVIRAEEVDRIAAFTDGIEFLGIDRNAAPHAPFFDPLFEFAMSDDASAVQLNNFLASERVCSRTDDDKTLLIAARK